MYTSRTQENPGRAFFRCVSKRDRGKFSLTKTDINDDMLRKFGLRSYCFRLLWNNLLLYCLRNCVALMFKNMCCSWWLRRYVVMVLNKIIKEIVGTVWVTGEEMTKKRNRRKRRVTRKTCYPWCAVNKMRGDESFESLHNKGDCFSHYITQEMVSAIT